MTLAVIFYVLIFSEDERALSFLEIPMKTPNYSSDITFSSCTLLQFQETGFNFQIKLSNALLKHHMILIDI